MKGSVRIIPGGTRTALPDPAESCLRIEYQAGSWAKFTSDFIAWEFYIMLRFHNMVLDFIE